jgi:pimeloyl-ACP methyl ester carboxylesterase
VKQVTANGITIAYQEQGQGEVIVLLHGFCGSSDYWNKITPLLANTYRVITPDLRGHGETEAPTGAYTTAQMAADIAGLTEQLGVQKYTLLGHSLGGYITLALAERDATHLSSFGLIHSTGYPDSEEAKANRLKAVNTIGEEGIRVFVDGLVPGLFAPEHLQTMAADVARAQEIGYHMPPQGAQGAALAMRERPDRTAVMQKTTLPLLLVAGEKDKVIPMERTFTTDGANVTKAVIKGAGHMSMYEAPAELAGIILDFMKKRS